VPTGVPTEAGQEGVRVSARQEAHPAGRRQGQAGAHVQPDGRAGLAQRLAKHIVAQHPEQARV
jgi:hypothetical protein